MPLGSLLQNMYNISGPDPITKFYNKFKRYPGNNKQWWVAKAQSEDHDGSQQHDIGDFLPEQLDKFYAGNNRAPRGHYILFEFFKDRSAVSGVAGIDREIIKERPPTVAFYSGRVWFGCRSTIYFSQVMTDRYKAGMCYQEADPTAEDISELIATDGGSIPIPEATRIVKLVADGEGILVFATNGVWSVTGTANGFTASDITVNKISHTGCSNPDSIIACEEGIFWWSDVGILGLSQKLGAYGPVLGVFDSSNISQTTIQAFYNNISEEAKKECKSFYDTQNNRIGWLYRDDDVGPNQFNRVLYLDVGLKAFFPWKFSTLENDPYFIKGVYRGDRLSVETEVNLIQVGGVQVQVGGVDVQHTQETRLKQPTTIEYFAMKGNDARFCQVTSTQFTDWYQVDNVGVTYESYVETGYDLWEDGMRKKRITYLMPFLRRTETGWNGNEAAPELENASSCWLTVKWDWASSSNSNKWTTPVQVYRNVRYLPMPVGEFDTGFPMVITKNKVRGNGRSIQFRFGTDEPARDFDIYGWAVAASGNTIP